MFAKLNLHIMVKIPRTNQERCRKLSATIKSDTKTLQKNRIETGYHPKQVEDVIDKIIQRNRE